MHLSLAKIWQKAMKCEFGLRYTMEKDRELRNRKNKQTKTAAPDTCDPVHGFCTYRITKNIRLKSYSYKTTRIEMNQTLNGVGCQKSFPELFLENIFQILLSYSPPTSDNLKLWWRHIFENAVHRILRRTLNRTINRLATFILSKEESMYLW